MRHFCFRCDRPTPHWFADDSAETRRQCELCGGLEAIPARAIKEENEAMRVKELIMLARDGIRVAAALAACLLLAPALAVAGRLDPSSLVHVGWFNAPGSQPTGKWNFGGSSPTYAADCFGQPDPSPGDGYPGCLVLIASGGMTVGVIDIVPPGQTATQVTPFFDPSNGVAQAQIGTGRKKYSALYYDLSDGGCRLWWAYADWFVDVRLDKPWFGVSDCSVTNQKPRGMWDIGPEGDQGFLDPFHTAKMYSWLSGIPQSEALTWFGVDDEMIMFGGGYRGGAFGGSRGPSLFVRPLTEPTVPQGGQVTDATGVYWYQTAGDSGRWWEPREFPPIDGAQWEFSDEAYDTEWVVSGSDSAVVVFYRKATFNPNTYPDNVTPHPYAGNIGDSNKPDPGQPTCWYGQRVWRTTNAPEHNPSYREQYMDRTNPPGDPLLDNGCPSKAGQGPHCTDLVPYLLFYDPADLKDVYNGAKARQDIAPYASVSVDWFMRDRWACQAKWLGATQDASGHVYAVQHSAKPIIHILEVGGSVDPPPDPCDDGCSQACPSLCPPPDPCENGCSVGCPQLCPDNDCDLAAGDSCLTDPDNCGVCPLCDETGLLVTVSPDGKVATVECKK